MMEKLHQLFLKLMDEMFWRALLSHIQWVDWITFGFLLAGFVFGMRKGFLREVAELLEVGIILTVTFIFQPMVLSFMTVYMPSFSQKTMAPAAFILTALCVWFVTSVIDKYFQQWIHGKLTGFLKTAGGGIVGVVHAFLIWSFISQAVVLMPLRAARQFYESGKSITGEAVKNFAPAVFAAVSEPGRYFSKQA